VPLVTLLPFINRAALFERQWGMAKDQLSKSESILNRLVDENRQSNIIHAQALYGYYACQSLNDELIVYEDQAGQKEFCRFAFPRQSSGQRLCLADFFRSQKSRELDIVAFQLVTVGQSASNNVRELFSQDKYQEYLYWRGLLAETANALAEWVHKRIRIEWGVVDEEPLNEKEIFKHHYRGARYSFGYSSCPHLEDQVKILELLQAERIGVGLSETFQLIPEESTSAIVIHHPQASYFMLV